MKSVSARSTCSGEALVVTSNRIRTSEHVTWHLSRSEMLGGDWSSVFGSLQQLRAKVAGAVMDHQRREPDPAMVCRPAPAET